MAGEGDRNPYKDNANNQSTGNNMNQKQAKYGTSIVYEETDEFKAQGQGSGGDTGSVAIPLKENDENQAYKSSNASGRQLTHSKKQIQGWMGEIQREQLTVSQINDEELVEMLRKEIESREEVDIEEYERK